MPDLDKHNLEVKELNPFQEFGISIFLITLSILAIFVMSVIWDERSSLKERILELANEADSINFETRILGDEIVSLKDNISKLSNTIDYHFAYGNKFLKEKNFKDAINEFNIVIDNYPKTNHAISARKIIKDIDRQKAIADEEREKELARIERERKKEEQKRKEREKYKPKSKDTAIAEWKKFRNNVEAYKGTITTWRFKISYISRENPIGWLSLASYQVLIYPDPWTYESARLYGFDGLDLPIIRDDDWVVVTGEFFGVSAGGVVILKPIKIINEGVK